MTRFVIPEGVTFDEHGLIPVVAQDHLTGEVRMVAFATAEAVRRTLETKRATFWSRSRGELWEKGGTSGNWMEVKSVLVDCDEDCLLYLVAPQGPTCHTGAVSCFFRRAELEGDAIRVSEAEVTAPTLLARLETVLEARKAETAKASYAKSLYEAGAGKIGEKLVEEAGENSQVHRACQVQHLHILGQQRDEAFDKRAIVGGAGQHDRGPMLARQPRRNLGEPFHVPLLDLTPAARMNPY